MTHPYPYNPYESHAPQPVAMDSAHHQNQMLWQAARFGAMVGATGAAAYNLQRMRRDGLGWQEVAMGTARAGLAAGAATAAATAVGSMLGRQSWLSAAASLTTGVAVMYVLEDMAKQRSEASS